MYVERVKIDTLFIPSDRAELVMTPVLLRDTIWQVIEHREGRATVQVIRTRDTLLIRANCDSVFKPFLQTDRFLYRSRANKVQEQKSTPNKRNKTFAWAVAAILIAFAAGVFIRR
jgi:hypothetical protein